MEVENARVKVSLVWLSRAAFQGRWAFSFNLNVCWATETRGQILLWHHNWGWKKAWNGWQSSLEFWRTQRLGLDSLLSSKEEQLSVASHITGLGKRTSVGVACPSTFDWRDDAPIPVVLTDLVKTLARISAFQIYVLQQEELRYRFLRGHRKRLSKVIVNYRKEYCRILKKAHAKDYQNLPPTL